MPSSPISPEPSSARALDGQARPTSRLPGLRRVSVRWDLVAEIALIGVWAAFVGRAFLDFNRFAWPMGREVGSQLQSHHLWTQLQQCGLCALWNGGINGGLPSVGDVFGSVLHPVVAASTLLWGVIDGAKIAIVASLWMAGLAQWWIGRTLGVGRAARMWSSLLVVVAGHLAGRLEVGAFGLVLSTAAASLAFAAALELGVTGRRRSTLRLAVTGAMAIVAGQGYLQLGLIAVAPAFLFLLLNVDLKLRPVWKEYALAIGLSVLLAGVFLLPALHFWPNLDKFADANFESSQPLEYILFNLVARDFDFLRTPILGKLPFPYLYNLFIGWVPVVLAVLGLILSRTNVRRLVYCLVASVVLLLLMASAAPLRWLNSLFPEMAGFRHAQLVMGLAVPAVLGLATLGLDQVLKLNWPQLLLRLRSGDAQSPLALSTAWILVIPLFWSVQTAYDFDQSYLTTANVEPVYRAVQSLRTPNVQWVAVPFGEHYWVEPALDAGVKVADVVWAWGWKDRAAPDAYLIATRQEAPPGAEVVGNLGELPLYRDSSHEYAAVTTNASTIPCQATGSGGDLTVRCANDVPGQLVLQENGWTGWSATMDDAPVLLLDSHRLSVDAPAGTHVYRFRYQPWDVPLGLAMTLIGIVLIVWLWIRSPATVGPIS